MSSAQNVILSNALLDEALTFQRLEDGALSAVIAADYSNGPSGMAPEIGSPFGGLVAALCAQAMQEGLDIKTALRTLSVQYLAAAKYGVPVSFRPRMMRAGRNVSYASVEAWQGERMTNLATASFGLDNDLPPTEPLRKMPPALESMPKQQAMRDPMAPHFAQKVEYRFDGGPNILGGNEGKPAVERCWMRIVDGSAVDEVTLCFLLDALYPPAWTISKKPELMTTVDFRIDILNNPTPENAPDGWVFFEFSMVDYGRGWTVDDAIAWGADGTPLAVARQRRKTLPRRQK